jgi:hypothetical protein
MLTCDECGAELADTSTCPNPECASHRKRVSPDDRRDGEPDRDACEDDAIADDFDDLEGKTPMERWKLLRAMFAEPTGRAIVRS